MNNDSDFDAIAAADELGDLPTSDDYTAELERKIAGLEAQLAAKDDEIAANDITLTSFPDANGVYFYIYSNDGRPTS